MFQEDRLMGRLVIVAGPTASGKTALAIRLAQALDGEIVSADSMQIYKRLDIGTAKPTAWEQAQAPHHMIDVVEPGAQYSVSRYAQQAAQCVDDILARGKLPIVCGGTGLYIEALVRGHGFSQGGQQTALRRQLEELWQQDPASLWRELQQVDPESAGRIHPNDKKRVLRALEVWRATGETISEHNRRTKALPPRYEALWLGLSPQPRQLLYDRINRRVTAMLEQGLVEEVRQLWQQGWPQGTAGQAIGYKEMVGYLQGQCTLEEAADQIRQKSRQYAKRQLTWFRHVEGIRWLCYGDEAGFEQLGRESTNCVRQWALR